MSGTPIVGDYIKAEGMAGRLHARLMAIVVEGERGRTYLTPNTKLERIADGAIHFGDPTKLLPMTHTRVRTYCVLYGLTRFSDLFTNRQLVALTTFSDLAQEVRVKVERDALATGLPGDGKGLSSGGTGAPGYADAVGVYLAFGRVASRNTGRASQVGIVKERSYSLSLVVKPFR